MAGYASDNFTRANSTGLGSNWSAYGGKAQMNIASNLAVPPSLAADAADIYTAQTFPANQYSKVTIGATGTAGSAAQGIGPIIRCPTGGALTGYHGVCGDATGQSAILKLIAGTPTTIASSAQAWSATDVALLTAYNSLISLFRNGALLLQVTDSSIASGYPGIQYYSVVTGSPSLSFWEGGFWGPDPAAITLLNDNFTRANANPIGSPYATQYGANAIQISGNLAQGTVTTDGNYVYDAVHNYMNDQWCQATVGGSPADNVTYSLMLRMNNSNNVNRDQMRWNFAQGQTTTTCQSSGGSIGTPALNTAPVAGDVFTFSVRGQTYRFYQNGALLATLTDSGASEIYGTPGFGFYTTGVLADGQFSNFQAGTYPVVRKRNYRVFQQRYYPR